MLVVDLSSFFNKGTTVSTRQCLRMVGSSWAVHTFLLHLCESRGCHNLGDNVIECLRGHVDSKLRWRSERELGRPARPVDRRKSRQVVAFQLVLSRSFKAMCESSRQRAFLKRSWSSDSHQPAFLTPVDTRAACPLSLAQPSSPQPHRVPMLHLHTSTTHLPNRTPLGDRQRGNVIRVFVWTADAAYRPWNLRTRKGQQGGQKTGESEGLTQEEEPWGIQAEGRIRPCERTSRSQRCSGRE